MTKKPNIISLPMICPPLSNRNVLPNEDCQLLEIFHVVITSFFEDERIFPENFSEGIRNEI